MHPGPLLLAVPNVSEGSDPRLVAELGKAFARARLLDTHSDADHGRSVFTLAARQRDVPAALLAGARGTVERLDLREQDGLHPRVGVLDVAPVVYLAPELRGAACAAALTAAALIGEDLGLPVFLYGDLATNPAHRERADLRRGGPAAMAARLARGELRPDHGPPRAHPSAGAVLVTARPPLVAFNLDLDSDDVELARAIAAELRESGGGSPGVRAMGLYLPARGRAQVSMNVAAPGPGTLAELAEAVRRRAPVAEAELVGLAPAAALEGFPEDIPLRDFDPARHLIENALGSLEP